MKRNFNFPKLSQSFVLALPPNFSRNSIKNNSEQFRILLIDCNKGVFNSIEINKESKINKTRN
jgi:hypothetical protein